MHHWENTLEKEIPEVLNCTEARKTMGKMLKTEGGTCAPKPMVFIEGTIKR